MRMKISSPNLTKRGCDEITFSFFAIRSNLLLSFSLTHAEGGMASAGSESVLSFDHQTPSLLVYQQKGQ